MATTAVDLAFTRQLMASNASAGLARTLIVSHLIKWNASRFIDRAVPVVSELFNNAVRVSRMTENVAVHASLRNPSTLWLGVADSSPDNPTKRSTVQGLEDLDSWEKDDLGGWGLGIVEACSDRFWVEPARNGFKWVCAEFRDNPDGRWSMR